MMEVLRGIVQSVTYTVGKIARATVKISDDRTMSDVEIFLQDGLDTLRAAGECILIKHGPEWILIASADRRENVAVSAGDKVMYTGTGQYVLLKANGGVEIKTAGTLTIECGSMSVNGDALEVDA